MELEEDKKQPSPPEEDVQELDDEEEKYVSLQYGGKTVVKLRLHDVYFSEPKRLDSGKAHVHSEVVRVALEADKHANEITIPPIQNKYGATPQQISKTFQTLEWFLNTHSAPLTLPSIPVQKSFADNEVAKELFRRIPEMAVLYTLLDLGNFLSIDALIQFVCAGVALKINVCPLDSIKSTLGDMSSPFEL